MHVLQVSLPAHVDSNAFGRQLFKLVHNVLTSKSMPYLGDMSKLTFFSKIVAAMFCILAGVGVSRGQLTTETLVVDGDARTYLLYLPDGHSADQNWPLVMNLSLIHI